MICKRCNNQMVWVGSMHGGKLECEHCANADDLLTEALYRETQEAALNIKGTVLQGVANAGGGLTRQEAEDIARNYRERNKQKCAICGHGLVACCCASGNGVGSAGRACVGDDPATPKNDDCDMNYMDYDI